MKKKPLVDVTHVFCALFAFLLGLVSLAQTLPDQDWERIDLDDDHTSIEAPDKSRRRSAIPTETAGDLEVPSVLRGFQVVSIGKQAFYGCSKLTSVVIPEGVTNIADEAFCNCSALTNVVFPSTLKAIGSQAFIGCGQLKQVRIEVSRLTIGDRAFRDCDSLCAVRFKGDELVVKDRAFFGCGGLLDVELSIKDVNLAEGVFSGGTDESSDRGHCNHLTNVAITASNRVQLGDRAFRNCDELRLVRINCDELAIGTRAFFGCGGLQELNLKAQLVNLAEGVFSGGQDTDSASCGYCDHLTSVVIAAPGLSAFGDSVFCNCSALQSIELPVGLVGVPTNAFSHCTSLQSVSLSSNVMSIAYCAFDTCTALRTVELSEGLRTIEDQAFYGCEMLESLDIPQSVSQIGARAFEQCKGLGRLVFCEGDTNKFAASSVSVGERAFCRNSSLTNIVLSQTVTSMGSRAFAECVSLVSVNLPTNLVTVSESLFEFCELLPAIDLPPSLAAIGASAFNSCTNLSSFLIPTQNVVSLGSKAFYRTKYWNEWENDTLVTNNGYILGFKGNPTSVDLPADCKAIPNGMFEGMSALTNVTIPAGLESVGSRAFYGTSIVSIDFSKTKLTSVGASAFSGCSSLVSCILSEKVNSIPDEAFRDCSSLVSFDIPASVVSIGASAFRDCVSLETVTGGEGVRTVGDYAFSGCVKLQPFRFKDGVAYGEHVFQGVQWTENVLFPSVGTMAQEYPQTYMDIKSVVISSMQTGIVDRACAGCAALESISIPESVQRVGVSAFEGCTSLRSVAFPADFSNIGSNAFKGCSAVVSLTASGGFAVKDVFREVYATIADVKIAAGTTSLCEGAFAGCAGLAELVVPVTLESIGDFAFENCTGLLAVKFMGPQPSANPNIYAGTSKDLWSKVRLNQANKDSWTTDGKMLPARWPVPESAEAGDYANTRRIGWWTDAPKDDSGKTITFYYYNTTGEHPKMSPEEGFAEIPDREGYDFLGWFTKPYGGVEVTEINYLALGVTAVYAHWVRNRDDHADPQTWDDVIYDVGESCTYDGYLLDGDAVVGTIQVKMAKGKYDRENECYNVSVTANAFILGEGKNVSFKGVAEDADEDGGSAELICTKKSDEREIFIDFSPNEFMGSLDDYEIVGARNLFAYSTDWDRRAALAAVDDCGGTYAAVLEANGDNPLSNGYAALSVKVSGKGKTKVSGVMPDGTKVSASSQLLIFPDANEYVVPVVVPLYSGKKGGFGFGLRFSRDAEFDVVSNVTVFGATEWTANPGKANEFTSTLTEVGVSVAGNLAGPSEFALEGSFEIDVEILPDGTAVTPSGTKWTLPKADKVKFDRETESYEILTDYENPAGLKLTYTAKTGTFKGSFKAYAVTDAGKSKKYTATVNGAVLNGTGYGSAVIKKVGSVPVVIAPEAAQ